MRTIVISVCAAIVAALMLIAVFPRDTRHVSKHVAVKAHTAHVAKVVDGIR